MLYCSIAFRVQQCKISWVAAPDSWSVTRQRQQRIRTQFGRSVVDVRPQRKKETKKFLFYFHSSTHKHTNSPCARRLIAPSPAATGDPVATQTVLAGHVTQKERERERERARERARVRAKERLNTEVAACCDCGDVHSHLDGFDYCACGHLIARTLVLCALRQTSCRTAAPGKNGFVDVDGPDFNGFTKTGLRTRRPGHDGGRAFRERHAV